MAQIPYSDFSHTLPGVFSWPSPPYAAYRSMGPILAAEACELEGLNGMSRVCMLTALDPASHQCTIGVPQSKVPLTIKFSQFKRITLKRTLHPLGQAALDEFAHLLDHRPHMPYQLLLSTGEEVQGESVGHVETASASIGKWAMSTTG